jgi:hypothetical protein
MTACPYWQRGYCVADKSCKLAHDPEEGGQLQETFLAQQRAQKQNQPPQPMYHQVSAVTMASALYGGPHALGYGYGYMSPAPMYGMMPPAAAVPTKNYKTIPCRHFMRGHCMRGSACGFRHGDDETSSSSANGFGQLPAELANPMHPGRPFRVVTCRRWAQGSCTLGDRCTFKHDFENAQHYTPSSPLTGMKRQLSGSENVVPSDQEKPVQESKVLKFSSEL